jgi:hypothetical protein
MYDAIAASHETYRDMPGAHGGPGFALWHREYLKRQDPFNNIAFLNKLTKNLPKEY